MKENPFPKVPFVIEEKGQKVFLTFKWLNFFLLFKLDNKGPPSYSPLHIY
jgi:hypothetical protein